MKKAVILALLAALPAVADVPDFSRYQIILDRKPFGQPPPVDTTPPPISPAESFARTLKMTALLETDDGGVRIGLFDQQGNQSFFLSVGQTENGVELVSADYDKEEAVIRKGSEMAVIKLQSGDIQPLNAQQQQQQLNAVPARRPSYAERRLARQQQRQAMQQAPQQPPPPPKYTGPELENHLQDYQMEVIRQGLPPLPIPLTPEMDAQLVAEGVLPPLE